MLTNSFRVTLFAHLTFIEPNGVIAQPFHSSGVVTDKKHGAMLHEAT